MFYAFRDEAENVTIKEAEACDFALGYIGTAELDEVGRLFDLPKNNARPCGYFKGRDCIGISLKNCDVYIKANKVIVAADNPKEVLPQFQNAMSKLDGSEVSNAKFLCFFVDEILANENSAVKEFQQKISALEKQVLDGRQSENINRVLYCEKQKCISLGYYYSELFGIVGELKDNDYDLFDEAELKYFDMLRDKTDRLCDSVKMLIESTVHLHEAYQSAIDLRLNNTMKLFTIVTVIFAPLSFVTGWFGMNFKNMFLLDSPLGVPIVCAVCAVVGISMFLWLKLKR